MNNRNTKRKEILRKQVGLNDAPENQELPVTFLSREDMVNFLLSSMEQAGVLCSRQQGETLIHYMELVLEKNQHLNLTAITEPQDFILRHFVDSLVVVNLPEYSSANKILDLGTGGGFPGVPLAVLSPDKKFTLMDSLAKRILAVEELTGKAGVHNVELYHGRAEDFGQNHEFRESFDLCVSRAVANVSVLAEYCLPFVKVGGYFISYKGDEIDQELNDGKSAIKTLGGRIRDVREVENCGLNHNLVIIEKVKSTPKKYPRQAGKPRKAPIR